jgi:RimJ/RimL family protein N-acetyltransferase
MFSERVETDRLRLEQFDADRIDPFDLYEIFGAGRDDVDEVFAHVPQEPYETVKEAHDQLDWAAERWRDREEARYAVSPSGDYLAGYTSLAPDWDRRTGTLGVILARPFWGQGYASECLEALTEIAFDCLDLDVVAVGYEEGNDRSERMVEQFVETHGGQYDGQFRNWTPLGDEVADHYRYTVSEREYRENGG